MAGVPSLAPVITVAPVGSGACLLVGDLRPIAALVGLVLHRLQPAVGQQNMVRAVGVVAIATLVMPELGTVLRSIHFVRKLVLSRFLKFAEMMFNPKRLFF